MTLTIEISLLADFLASNFLKASQVLFLWAIASVCGALALHGFIGGLVRRKVIKNLSTREYATGREAVTRGWAYVIVGLIGFMGIAWFAYLYAIQP